MKSLTRVGALLALVLTFGLIPAFTGSSGAQAGNATVYVVHGVPGVTVDVYVNGNLTLEDFAPDTITDALSLPAGTYDIDIVPAAADPKPPTITVGDGLITGSATVEAGGNYSVVAHLAVGGGFAISAFVNDVSPVEPGSSRVIVRHTADAPAVDIVVDGTRALTGLTNPNQVSAELPAGTYDLGVAVSPDGPTVLDLPGTAIPADKVVIVYAVGDPAPNEPVDGEATPAQQAPTFKVLLQVLDPQQPETTTTTAAPTTTQPETAPVTAQPRFTG